MKVNKTAVPSIHLSPKKPQPSKATGIQDLEQSNKKQDFEATPQEVILTIHQKCPALGCGKSVHHNENTDIYSCDKCNKNT